MQYEHNPHRSQAYSDPAGKSSALASLAPPPLQKSWIRLCWYSVYYTLRLTIN